MVMLINVGKAFGKFTTCVLSETRQLTKFGIEGNLKLTMNIRIHIKYVSFATNLQQYHTEL